MIFHARFLQDDGGFRIALHYLLRHADVGQTFPLIHGLLTAIAKCQPTERVYRSIVEYRRLPDGMHYRVPRATDIRREGWLMAIEAPRDDPPQLYIYHQHEDRWDIEPFAQLCQIVTRDVSFAWDVPVHVRSEVEHADMAYAMQQLAGDRK